MRERAAREGDGAVAAFDLDGCLFDTRPRQVHIFREYASRTGQLALYKVEARHFRDWDLGHTLANAGVEGVPLGPLRDYWARAFFSSAYVLHDHALPGAAALVHAVRDAGVHVVYLTGRDDGMRPGTEEALRRFGFPLDVPRATLLTKPRFDMDDTLFKESALETLARLGRVVLYVDNEPANVNLFQDRHPDALVVFVETDHSPRPDRPHGKIPWLRSFR
jgi:phosphoserine phosphatase